MKILDFMCTFNGAALVVAIGLFVFCTCISVSAEAAVKEKPKPMLQKIYSMEGCGPCEDLKAFLTHHRIPTVTRIVRVPAANIVYYPTVFYTVPYGGNKETVFSDNGTVAMTLGGCRYPETPVEIIYYKPLF